jgi:hypothetical protein
MVFFHRSKRDVLASRYPSWWHSIYPCYSPRSRPVDRSSCRTASGPARLARRTAFCTGVSHVCAGAAPLNSTDPTTNDRRGRGLRDKIMHRRRARDRSRCRQAPDCLALRRAMELREARHVFVGATRPLDGMQTSRRRWRKHMLAGDDLCVAHAWARQRSPRLSHDSPDKRSVPRVFDPPEPDWPKRLWQSSWVIGVPIAGQSVLTSIDARITGAGRTLDGALGILPR